MSYRREDTGYPAAWLYDRLARHFRRSHVFKDIDSSIEPDDNFVDVITAAVGSCDVLLALIGNRWLTITGQDGQRRLDNADDFVRLELEAALTRNIRVIPVLVKGPGCPAPMSCRRAWPSWRASRQLSSARAGSMLISNGCLACWTGLSPRGKNKLARKPRRPRRGSGSRSSSCKGRSATVPPRRTGMLS